jgi:hypothetical protein
MLGSNAILAGAFGFLMCEAENTPCSLCKSFHASHNNSPKIPYKGFYQKAGRRV